MLSHLPTDPTRRFRHTKQAYLQKSAILRKKRQLFVESLEDRRMLTTLYWLGTNGPNWNADNWTNASGGSVVVGLRPVSNDSLRFDTTQANFNNTAASFTSTNNIAGLAGLQLTIIDASATGDFNIGGTAINTGASGVSSTVSTGVGATLGMGITLGASQSFVSSSGLLTVSSAVANGGNLLTVSGTGSTTISGNMSGIGGLTKSGSGTLTLSGFNSYSGATTVSVGTLAVSGGFSDGVIQNSSVTINAGGTFLYTGGNNLVGNSVPFTVDGTLDMNTRSDVIASIRGSGTIINNSTNTFEGLSFAKLDSAYTFSGNISGNGRLGLRGELASSGSLTLSGGTYGLSRIDVVNGTLNLNGTVTTTSDVIVGSTQGFSLPTTGSAAVNVQGGTLSMGGILRLGAGTYNGAFTQSTGAVSAAGIDMNAGTGGTGTGSVTLSGGTFTIGGSGAFAADTGARTLNIGLATVRASAPFTASIAATISSTPTIDTNGRNVAWSGAISGSGNLTKIGTGTLTLSGTNTYTGTTTVNAGTLSVTGSTAAGNAVIANGGGTLAGTGTVNGTATIASGGTLSPGLSAGVLSTGNLSVSGGYTVELAGNSGPGAANGHDQDNVTGTVTLGGSSTLTLNLTGLTAAELSANPTFVIINNDGSDAVNGAFLGLAEGSLVASNIAGSGKSLVISYVGGSGNDVVLRTVPPPSITSNSGAVTANEGGTVSNAGTFFGMLGNNTVTITASIGTVTRDNDLGTWNWNLDAADGPAGPSTVTITATDNVGAAANTTFTYGIDNVPPTISLSGNAEVDEGSEYTLYLGAVTDPGQDSIQSYIIDWGDGTTSGVLTGTPANTTATHTYADGPDTRTNNITVTDEDGNFLAGELNVLVKNVAPTVNISGPSNVDERAPYSLTLGAVTDPGTDTVTSYIVHWGDGNSNTYASSGVHTHTYADGPNSYAITVDLVDEDGTFLDQANALSVMIDNVAPTATVNSYTTSQSTPVSGNVITDNTGSGVDSDPAGTNDPLTVVAHTSPSNGVLVLNANGSFTYTPDSTFAGTVSFEYTISDGDGGLSTATVTINVTAAAPGSILTINDTCVGGTALLITGTSGNDTIVVHPGETPNTLVVTFNGVSSTVTKPSGRIIVTGGAGNDNIQIAGAILNPVWLYGDAGDDRLNAGNGGSLLIGGDGNDQLLGGGGRDIMIGGEGADNLVGNSNADILVAGYTTKDTRNSINHEEFWCEVLEEWNSTRLFFDRVENLRSVLLPEVIDDVFADAIDFLNGSAGDDWLIFGTGEDKVSGKAELSN